MLSLSVQDWLSTTYSWKKLDSSSVIWLGGSLTGLGCRCKLAQTRFYTELYINDDSLMPKFSDYGTGNSEIVANV